MRSRHALTTLLACRLLTACSGGGSLEEIAFPEEPTGINAGFAGATVYGTGRADLWAPVPGRTGNGSIDPMGNHVMHHTGGGVTSMPLPPQILALPGYQPTSYAAGKPGELWMVGAQGSTGAHQILLVSMAADGTVVDHSAQMPAIADFEDSPVLLSDHGAVLVSYGGMLVRVDGDVVEKVPDPPAGSFPQLIAFHGHEVYGISTPSGAAPSLLRYNGSAWATVPEIDATGAPFGFSFNGDEGWAFGSNHGAEAGGMYPIYHFDGAWTALTLTVVTSFEIPGNSTWTPIHVLATSPGHYALLGESVAGESGTTAQEHSVVYRTGTVGGLSSDETALTPVEDTCSGSCESSLSFLLEADDGTFLMNTGRGGAQAPTRIFAGNRADLK